MNIIFFANDSRIPFHKHPSIRRDVIYSGRSFEDRFLSHLVRRVLVYIYHFIALMVACLLESNEARWYISIVCHTRADSDSNFADYP